jgi:hypothetical protein
MAAVHEAPPDVIGFANYGWNEQLNLVVGAHMRTCAPEALIVAGGPNIDANKDNRKKFLLRHSYLDYLIIDGGEQPFAELVAWWRETDCGTAELPNNVAYLGGGVVCETVERPLKKIITDIPSPYLSGFLDEFLAAGMIPLFETNRGCPFKCTFCAWGAASKDLVRRMDLDQSLAEIDYVGARSDARNWIVCDANFGILKRDVDIARAIRDVKDRTGSPEKCHIWLAKNVTERNLEIGEIFGDMTVPVMAVQSLDEAVLANYQQKFHAIGSRTYSDLIVPLPGETLASHLAALGELMRLGVDIIQNHNMRLLAGAETNDPQTRHDYAFRSRYRLIHGDAGIYYDPEGLEIHAFEFEESLRATNSMDEEELFYLRQLHFLVDFSWNLEAYRPMLKAALAYGANPTDILETVLERAASPLHLETCSFLRRLDAYSHEEWFESEQAISDFFAAEENFNQLINQDFEKLNIMFSVVLLRDVKAAFDDHFETVIRETGVIPEDVLRAVSRHSFAIYPPLDADTSAVSVDLPENYFEIDFDKPNGIEMSENLHKYAFAESPKRREVCELLGDTEHKTLSKILNTQGLSLRDLRLESVA